jgi:hypothetical protein
LTKINFQVNEMLEEPEESHQPEKPQALSAIVVFCFPTGNCPALPAMYLLLNSRTD